MGPKQQLEITRSFSTIYMNIMYFGKCWGVLKFSIGLSFPHICDQYFMPHINMDSHQTLSCPSRTYLRSMIFVPCINMDSLHWWELMTLTWISWTHHINMEFCLGSTHRMISTTSAWFLLGFHHNRPQVANCSSCPSFIVSKFRVHVLLKRDHRGLS